jgi:hypothetical protein
MVFIFVWSNKIVSKFLFCKLNLVPWIVDHFSQVHQIIDGQSDTYIGTGHMGGNLYPIKPSTYEAYTNKNDQKKMISILVSNSF